MNKFNDLKLYRGATSVIELDFNGFVFAENSKCQLTIEKKYNNDVIYQHDFDKPIKYYVTFKDEFTANLDDDKYKYDIMYMLNDERYPQCEISDIYMEEVINNYNGEVNPDAVEVTEVLTDGVEVNDTIKINNSNIVIINSKLQELSITPSKEEQVITPNEDYDGFSKVIVDPIPNEYIIPTGALDIKTNGTHEVSDKASVNVNVQPSLQDKTVIVKPSDNTYIMPDEDYYGLALVNVIGAVDTETVEATPTKEVQTINRSEDKYIESVKVNAIPDEYIVPSGELEITENGQYDVTDKASVNVETSGADLSEYFNINPETFESSISSPFMFNNYFKKLPDLVIPDNVTKISYLFGNDTSSGSRYPLNVAPKIIFNNNVTNISGMCSYINKDIELDLTSCNVENVKDMSNCFYQSKITSLDLKTWMPKSVTNLYGIFYYCTGLTFLDIRNFEFTKESNAKSVFGSSASSGPPNDCLIIVKDEEQKTWVTTNYTRLTNVKTVAEYEAG